MKPADKFSTYARESFLQSVAEGDRAIARRLCEALEAAFDVKDIAIYSGFPIVVRDLEWIAGFAMRKAGPIAYCCSPATLAAMGAELKPYMSGKSCIAVKPRKGETIDDVLAMVARAFQVASTNGGMISKTDAKRREKMRAASDAKSVPKTATKKTAKKTVPKAAPKTAPKTAKKATKKSTK